MSAFDDLTIRDAQREVRRVYRGGFVGQVVSGVLWLAAAALATWVGFLQGEITLVVGGMLIFPLTTLVLRLLGGPASMAPAHPFNFLAMQTAFIVPLLLPVVIVLAMHDHAWFFPSVLLVVGAHYLPFATLYGMKEFLFLGAAMMAGGVWLGFSGAPSVAGGWLGAALLFGFVPFGWRVAVNEERREARKE